MSLKRGYLFYFLIVLSIIAINSVIWFNSGNYPWEPIAFNSYSIQAKTWLEGRLDLGMNYMHLELAIYKGKYFVSFPPFPTVIVLPFVLFFDSAPESLINVLFVFVSGVYAFKISRQLNIHELESLFLSLFLVIASNVVFLTVCGWVWFIAQTMSFTFTLMSFYYALTYKKYHSALSLFFLACAFGCRPFQILYAPLLLYLFYIRYKKSSHNGVCGLLAHLTITAVPALVLGVLYMILNYFRFDNPFEFGHNYLPEFVEAANGQFSFEYFKHNLPLLFRLPKFENGSLSIPFFNGIAFWLVSPIFIVHPLNLILNVITEKNHHHKDWVLQTVILLTIILHLLLTCFHKTMGGWHFGNRYTVDALPAVFLGITYLRTRRTAYMPMRIFYLLLFISGIAINLYGTLKIYTA